VLESSDVNEIREKTNALQEAAQKLAEAVYAQATAAQQAQSSGDGNGASAAEDEVVEEADYEVIDEEEEAKKS
jgi:molecular chaperone DnaK